MSYNPNIPTVNDLILQSFQQLRTNFQQINRSFASNHEALTKDQSIAGKHSFLTMRKQPGDPVTDPTQIALYNKLVAGIPELFFAPSSSQTPIQLTYPSIKTDGSADQFSFVAGPFVILGGLKSVTDLQNIILSPGTNLLFVSLMPTQTKVIPASFMPLPTAFAGMQFTVRTGVPLKVYYLAIASA